MIKSLILNYKIGNFAKKRGEESRSTATYQHAQKIGIAFTSNDMEKVETVETFAKELRADGKSVEILSFSDSRKEQSLGESDGKTISKKDLTVSGKWKTEEVNHFINSSFDYLLHLDLERNKYIDYIFAQSKAVCRIGAYLDDDQHHYELIVSLAEKRKLKEYLGELKKYLKIIGSNEH